MNKMILVVLVACAFLTSGSMMILPANAEGETIFLSDPPGDVFNDGFTTDVFNNVDITALTMNTGSEVIVFEMKVLGIVIYENTDYDHNYFIYIDHDGDGDKESTIIVGIISGIAQITFTSEYGVGYSMSFDVSGNGTNTLHIEIPLNFIDGSPGITDIYGKAEVWYRYNIADDLINEYFGVVPVDDDDDWDDDYETEGDPTTHTPTDESIGVSIDSYGAEFDDSGEKVEMEINVEGSTSGTVVKCAWTTVTYFKNGSYEVGGWDVGPYDNPETTSVGFTSESYFKGIDGEGDDDWSSWGYKLYFGILEELYDLYDRYSNMGMDSGYDMDVENVTRMIWVVRAFSDEEMIMWNQDTKDVTDEYKAFISGESTKKEDEGWLPGFELFGAVVAFIAVAGLGFTFRRRR